MELLGVTGYPLTVSGSRLPDWPPMLVGSISHTRGYCGAAVARRDLCRSMGLDCEIVDKVTPDLWTPVASTQELSWLRSLPRAQGPKAAALIFAAKEAFFKCQFPLAQEWLDFRDVSIEPVEWQHDAAPFRIVPQRRIRLATELSFPLFGRYRFHENYVCAGLAISAE
jgi:4'-phosphopantetheinyl transferase EntD